MCGQHKIGAASRLWQTAGTGFWQEVSASAVWKLPAHHACGWGKQMAFNCQWFPFIYVDQPIRCLWAARTSHIPNGGQKVAWHCSGRAGPSFCQAARTCSAPSVRSLSHRVGIPGIGQAVEGGAKTSPSGAALVAGAAAGGVSLKKTYLRISCFSYAIDNWQLDEGQRSTQIDRLREEGNRLFGQVFQPGFFD